MVPLLTALLACTERGDDKVASDDTGLPAWVNPAGPGGAVADPPVESGPDDSTGPQDTGQNVFEEVSVDEDTFGADGYEVATWYLNPDIPDAYTSLLEGREPTFYIFRPRIRPDTDQPVLFWIHGGSLGDDRSGELPRDCDDDKVVDLETNTLTSSYGPFIYAMQNQWAIVLPRNDWCDFWTGLGPTDPIDPERHYGYLHTKNVMDFVLKGFAKFPASGERYIWGTSAGGGAAVHLAHKYGGFSGIVADSAPSSMFLWWRSEPNDTEDVFGGPPYDESGVETEWYPYYAAASAEWLVTEGGLDAPIYVTWNTQDERTPKGYPTLLNENLEKRLLSRGARYGEHDYDHPAPSDDYHTQSRWPMPPFGYTTRVLWDFLVDDKQLLWVEAEDGCVDDLLEDCVIGAIYSSEDPDEHTTDMSKATAIRVSPGAAEGVAWAAHVPSELPVDQTITATLILDVEELGDTPDDTVVGEFSWEEAGRRASVVLRAGDFSPDEDATNEELYRQYQTSRLSFTAAEAGAGTLRYTSYGLGDLWLDAVVFSY